MGNALGGHFSERLSPLFDAPKLLWHLGFVKLNSWQYGVVGLVGLWVISWIVSGVPAVTRFDPNFTGLPMGPSLQHWLGTDEMGRDLLLRCVAGAKLSLGIGFMTIALSTGIGTTVGLLAGFAPRWGDAVLMRFTDLMLCIPGLFLMLTLQAILGPSIWHVVAVLGLTSWMGIARLVRSAVLSIKERPFILAAHARGLPRPRILWRHIFPHTLNPIIVCGIIGMGNAILSESVLSFLGLGVQPPLASWGNLLENSLSMMQTAPWLAIAPGVWITGTVLSLHWIGDRLRG